MLYTRTSVTNVYSDMCYFLDNQMASQASNTESISLLQYISTLMSIKVLERKAESHFAILKFNAQAF